MENPVTASPDFGSRPCILPWVPTSCKKPFWFSSHHPKGGPCCLMLGLCNNLLTGFCFHRSESSHAYENGLPTGLLCPVTSPCLGGRRWALFPGCGNSCSPGWAIGILRLGLGFLCALSSEHTQVSASWGQPWLWCLSLLECKQNRYPRTVVQNLFQCHLLHQKRRLSCLACIRVL